MPKAADTRGVDICFSGRVPSVWNASDIHEAAVSHVGFISFSLVRSFLSKILNLANHIFYFTIKNMISDLSLRVGIRIGNSKCCRYIFAPSSTYFVLVQVHNRARKTTR